MNLDAIIEYCSAKEGVEACFPFNEDTLVFKVNGKMFLLVSITAQPVSFNVKCDPEKAVILRERYECITPGFHMSKSHWNTVTVDNTLTRKMLLEQIDHSYDLVRNGKAKSKAKKK
jgi:predicted DNA-binding protein (MmcQ/YjbR family)